MPPIRYPVWPTAQQLEVDVHVTLARTLSWCGLVLGELTTGHAVPSQCWIRVWSGRFVLAAGLVMRVNDLPSGLLPPLALAGKPESYLLRGGSAIIGPNGRYLVEPCFDRETIITAELDLTAVDEERMTLDVSGHYSRPDIFDFQVRKSSG